jgi:hypothetical protein
MTNSPLPPADALSPAPAPSLDTPPDDSAPQPPLMLTPEQLSSLGLDNCQPGDTYTIRLTKGTDEGSFDVDGIDVPLNQEPDADDATPPDSTLPDEPADEPPSDAPDASEQALGYRRKAKDNKLPFPTGNLRDI